MGTVTRIKAALLEDKMILKCCRKLILKHSNVMINKCQILTKESKGTKITSIRVISHLINACSIALIVNKLWILTKECSNFNNRNTYQNSIKVTILHSNSKVIMNNPLLSNKNHMESYQHLWTMLNYNSSNSRLIINKINSNTMTISTMPLLNNSNNTFLLMFRLTMQALNRWDIKRDWGKQPRNRMKLIRDF